MIRRGMEPLAEELCLEFYYFIQDLRIIGTSFALADKRVLLYNNFTFMVCYF